MVIDLFAQKNKPRKFDRLLINETQNVKLEIENAMSQFNCAENFSEIEAVIYRLKSLETRYSFLIKSAKLNETCNFQPIEIKKI